jgi:hypothetical protein
MKPNRLIAMIALVLATAPGGTVGQGPSKIYQCRAAFVRHQ